MPRSDPLNALSFRVEIDGEELADFSEVSGLSSETAVIEYREGTDKARTVRKLPGLNKFPSLVLKRGITDSMALWEWRKAIMVGDLQRKTVRVIVLDDAGQDAATFEFTNAWPSKYETSDLDAAGNDVVIETLELAHEGLERTS